MMKFIGKMSNLELEIRSYIIIFGVAFLIGILSGCQHTATHGASGYTYHDGGNLLVPMIKWAF